jgi:hypothetical protein
MENVEGGGVGLTEKNGWMGTPTHAPTHPRTHSPFPPPPHTRTHARTRARAHTHSLDLGAVDLVLGDVHERYEYVFVCT